MNPCYVPGVARDAAGSRLEQTARAAWSGAARGGLTDPVDVRDPETVALAKLFRTFAAGVARDHGAFRYQRICEAVAGDEELLSLVSLAPPNQRRPTSCSRPSISSSSGEPTTRLPGGIRRSSRGEPRTRSVVLVAGPGATERATTRSAAGT